MEDDSPAQIYEFGPFRVDGHKRLLLRSGVPVKLPAKAFEILLVLLQENGRLVEKNDLIRRVWSDSIVEENNLTVNISALRKCLSESPEHRFVMTVPGRGYQFVADLKPHGAELENRMEDNTSPHAFEALDLAPTNAKSAATLMRFRVLVTAVLLVTIMAGSYFVYSRFRNGESAKGRITSIAVLPFTNETGDPNAEYLSDGISESLINSLSQLHGVKVIARSSTLKYKNTNFDLDSVAKALNVETILTGRVTQRGENLSISVELIHASDKAQVWGEHYDRQMSDLLAIQRDIAREIIEKLKNKVTGEDGASPKHYTENNEAYQLYLKGRFFWNKRTAEALKKSIEYFNEAIAKDPGFALAYAGIADSYVVPANRLAPREAMPKAKAAAMRALELDETLPEAHASLGRVLAAYDWDWPNAEKEYKRAISLNPTYAIAHQWYGGYLSVMGRSNEATAEKKQALELEPLSLIINFEVGVGYFYDRDYDRAIEQFQRTIELDQDFPTAHNFLPAAYEQKQMYNEAIAEFRKAMPLTAASERTITKGGLGHLYARIGKKEEAKVLLGELTTMAEQEYVPGTSLALIYAGLDDKENALSCLERGYDQKAFQMQWIKLDPRWDNLRAEPRFRNLIKRMGMPE